MDQGRLLRVNYMLSNTQMFLNTLDFVARTTHDHLRGTSASERNLLANIYRGFRMTPPDLEAIFESHHSGFLVQVGHSFEMRRKDVSVWVFVDSITDVAEFVASAWREKQLQDQCVDVLDDQWMHEYYTVLNQLIADPSIDERRVWLYSLRRWCEPTLSGLRAVYEPRWLYGCPPETADLMNSLIKQDYNVLAMAFDPCGEDRKLATWLDEVKDHLVVTVTDRDDAGRQMHISILPGCESDDCLLRRHFGQPVKIHRAHEFHQPVLEHTHVDLVSRVLSRAFGDE